MTTIEVKHKKITSADLYKQAEAYKSDQQYAACTKDAEYNARFEEVFRKMAHKLEIEENNV